ncbi:hypothetical protein [Roseibium sediminis]|uniref:hypothetical protein n=1 Tax=Roseibium sediminis TaxID=1775174 RepID=UPI00123D1469|nr:hypothetical protein [Roseibium sediminis]
MAKRAAVTEADMRRAIKAAKGEGLTVRECIMSPSEVRLVFTRIDSGPETNTGLGPKQWPGTKN